MKMLTAIVNKKDAPDLADGLKKKGYMFTEIGSTGGFLRAGNTTIIMGVEDEKVDDVLKIIRRFAGKRAQNFPTYTEYGAQGAGNMAQILIGGATVFVTPVDRFEKL